jgi:hypothetical protein
MIDQSGTIDNNSRLQWLGAVVLIAALPMVFVIPETLSPTAWLITSALWAVHMLTRVGLERLSARLSPTLAMGISGIGMMLRVWSAAIVIFVIGADTAAGVTIGFGRADLAVSVLLLFAVAFTVDVIARTVIGFQNHSNSAAVSHPHSLPEENQL